jgi:hypothetical protein
MEDKELVLIQPRSRRMPQTMYLAGIVVKGTENLPNPQFVVYSANPNLLKVLVSSHNELLKIKSSTKQQQKQE